MNCLFGEITKEIKNSMPEFKIEKWVQTECDHGNEEYHKLKYSGFTVKPKTD